MGKLNEFTIILDNPVAVYQAGSVLTGNVIVDLKEPMKMRAIRVRFYGGANVHWSETETTGPVRNPITTTHFYGAKEVYFDITVAVFGDGGGDHPIHPAGRYQYPVQFQLPLKLLPSSFEGAWGQVRYWLRGIIDKPWQFDHHCKRAFTVLSILDLNIQPNILEMQRGQAEKMLCCLCCASGPITAQFSIDRRGYVPGEFLVVNGEVINNSRRRMCSSKVEIKMITRFHATSKSRTSSSVVTSLKKGEIKAGDTEVWSGELLHIPPLPPSALMYCRIIDIEYQITMVVDPAGPALDLEVPLEVIIGTVPLRNVNAIYSSAPPSNPAGGAIMPMPDDAAVPSASAYTPPEAYQPTPNAPPPSYAKCAFGKVKEEIDNEWGKLNYAPAYTYYNWNQPPPVEI